jgi:hypothetical protein
MAAFVINFYKPPALTNNDMINDMIQSIMHKYDINRSGFLEKREVLRLVDDILMEKN